jgi:hypothetical protein
VWTQLWCAHPSTIFSEDDFLSFLAQSWYVA